MKKEITKQQLLEAHESSKELFGKVIIRTTIRPNGTLREQQDFTNCPTMAEQHTGHLTDINYLIDRYKPDELQAYLAARNQYRQEILGHDFSKEPNLQEAKNIIYTSKQEFEALPDDIKNNFKSHLEFLKFIDNPMNKEKMIKLGILTENQINKIVIPETNSTPATAPTTTQEEAAPKPK